MAIKKIILVILIVGIAITGVVILNKTHKTKEPEAKKEVVGIKKPEANKEPQRVKENLSREKAPNFVLSGISGNRVRLSDYRGKVLIVDFWDTWCNPCKMEIPGFVKLQEEWGDKGLQIIGVAFAKQGIDAVRAFAKRYKINYPVAICDEQTLNSYGPIRGIPTTFVLDKGGRIYKKYIGYRPEEIFIEDIKNLISE